MFRIINLVSITFLIISCKAISAQEKSIIDIKQLYINGTIQFGDSEETIRTRIGSPSRTKEVWNEILELKTKELYYGKSLLNIDNNHNGRGLDHFEICDQSLYLTYNGNSIKVGDAVSKLKDIFPASYATRGFSEKENIPIMIVKLKVKVDNEYIDLVQYFAIFAVDNKISKIEYNPRY